MTAPELGRFRLIVQYDGRPFLGWQRQKVGRTVQAELEETLNQLTGERRPVTGAGRTDRGVHALGQVASVEVPSTWSAAKLRTAMNALLPPEIWIQEAQRTPACFHPRRDAVSRTYEYRLGLVEAAASPMVGRWCWNVSRNPPDPEILARAAEGIPGDRSFRKFAKSGQPHLGEQCRVTSAEWAPWDGPGLRFRITANRYLHHMVRYLVGTMVDVGRARRSLEEMDELLVHPESSLTTSPPAPPQGLFLFRVEYPPERLGEDPDRDPAH